MPRSEVMVTLLAVEIAFPSTERDNLPVFIFVFFASCPRALACEHGAGLAHPGVVRDIFALHAASDTASVHVVKCADNIQG